MPENFTPGGGLQETLIGPAGLILAALAILLIFILPRKYMIIPFLAGVVLIPRSQVFVVAGLHFMISRILILLGGTIAIFGALAGTPREWGWKFNPIDRAYILCGVTGVVAYTILWGTGEAFLNRMGILISTVGLYLVLRALIRDWKDVDRATTVLAVIMVVLAVCMLGEHVFGKNVFALFGGINEDPEVRKGHIRAQAAFAHPILAGTFGATMFPLFFGLWWWGKRQKGLAIIGTAAAAIMVITSASSTPIGAVMGGLAGLGAWRFRHNMKRVRWWIVIGMILLQLKMHNPIWHVLVRFNITEGSTGWHRYELIDQFIRHFKDWWLIGTRENDTWGIDTWDSANQYVATGISGGVVAFFFLILTIKRGFRAVGLARKKAEGDLMREGRIWMLGAVLLAQVAAFLGISYFDQTVVVWCLTLAMISAVCVNNESRANDKQPVPGKEVSADANAFTVIGARVV